MVATLRLIRKVACSQQGILTRAACCSYKMQEYELIAYWRGITSPTLFSRMKLVLKSPVYVRNSSRQLHLVPYPFPSQVVNQQHSLSFPHQRIYSTPVSVSYRSSAPASGPEMTPWGTPFPAILPAPDCCVHRGCTQASSQQRDSDLGSAGCSMAWSPHENS